MSSVHHRLDPRRSGRRNENRGGLGTIVLMESTGEQGTTGPRAEPDGETTPDGEGGGQRRRRGRLALWAALMVVMGGVGAAVVLRDPPRSPEEDLALVRDFVDGAGTARFEGTARSEYGSGPDEPGSTSIDVTRVEGSFALPGRLHSLEDSGGYVFESIVLPTGSYFRSADGRAELDGEPWSYGPPADGGGESVALAVAAGEFGPGAAEALSAASGVLGAFGAPFDLAHVLGRLGEVRRVSPGVLEASVPLRHFLPAELVEAVEREAAEAAADEEAGSGDDEEWVGSADDILDGTVTVRLTHAPDGRLDELEVTTVTGEGEDRSSDRSTLRFSGWGEPVVVEAPDPASVDPTPGIDEEDLAEFRAFPVVAPADPPAGMFLEYATVTDEDAEEETCASAELSYGTRAPDGAPEDDEAPAFLRVTVVSAACPWADGMGSFFGDTSEATPVTVGAHRGELRELRFPGEAYDEGMVNLRFTVDGVTVSVDSDLPSEQVVATMATVGPLDVAAQPVVRSDPPPAR
jgi:hypothetical protein